ncbi:MULTISPECIES: PTS sugar transporter subunit IIA [Nocardiopsis]|uniref:Mannitol-specific phosphotransferase enzyme IIA component n=1 Tax=Nocardiopsis dassonvillei (strain ATCC 23218 / DSM 43111 / CIP 107115 / JCM 7437 / KCTC 9190 / NBRC 14626 / NCTC 10488 / NRRL B-5397 / IMRU 509) TaxID=446468 RepID=D7AVV4_NOCDD|nr:MULTISPECIES: PTS sugar transporter subunit IIA [Nocardiopsis]ADH69614.1 phosphoenolpyruvate-dependent sugar phosphotransferase system EIIA 2 [Nocardiopsis dassonvillei subsp. dassonvillei DSM 43111]APC37614.1 PTS sugar transporter subunit IIA [Nocardiopsis dassonvillei]ASU60557.1 PTS sugar transporter subunit IIA [Nocardiopsis dassonvillei]MCP3014623.1 PTS sugar transporter subunit IIA [Nocardiopsis dassonvillei]NKY78196.1 PTS sugar transporter subunit IIA [Nocardiopsis dassonvillei]
MPNDLALTEDAVRLGREAADRADAIDQCGALLVELGAVEPGYVPAMHEREASIPTFVGEGVAIPHGTDASRALVKRTALAVVQFPGGVDWGGPTVHVAIGIAASGDEHLGVLSSLAGILTDPEKAARLRSASTTSDVLELLGPLQDG